VRKLLLDDYKKIDILQIETWGENAMEAISVLTKHVLLLNMRL